jgi:hypothetical protein
MFYLGWVDGRDDSGRPGRDSWPGRDGSPGEDILEAGSRRLPLPRWRPPLIAVVLAAVGLLAGLVAGYAAGAEHARNGAADSSPSVAATSTAAASAAGILAQSPSGGLCSAQAGNNLQLGVQVTNQSATAVTLRQARAVLPLGGLRPISQVWGPCGQLSIVPGPPYKTVPAGASAWFTVTFRVLVKCPGPLPVQFVLGYYRLGRLAAVHLPGFDDLGQVPYSRCPTH